MRKDMYSDDPVKIASCIFIDEFESKNQSPVSGVLYNKFMTLLYEDLKKDRIDIKLPHCWYRWGDEVVRHRMPYLRWNHDNPSYTEVTWGGTAPNYSLEDPLIRKIVDFADDFISKYSGPEGAEMAIDEVYKNAPFKFQNEYRRLRETLKISKRTVAPRNYVNSMIMPLFEDAMRVFPKEFDHISSVREEFESVFRTAAEAQASSIDLFDIVEDFWFFFCYHLRLNPKCHENVPRSTLEVWEDRISWETEMYVRSMQNFAKKFASVTDDPIIKKLINDRESRLEEFEDIMSEFDCDFEDMHEFIDVRRAD